MATVVNVFLAVMFVTLAFCATMLMYHLWGYPFNAKKHRSSAPPWAMALHRYMGWAFVLIYLYMMYHMVPRMWTYQIELPARTVFHLVLGYSIGALLIAKIAVVRFFKHLESTLAPPLGTTLFILTILLMGLALPSVWRETVLANRAMNGEGFSEERLQRVRDQLPPAGLEDLDLLPDLASVDGLLEGRSLLRTKCVLCHDLRTILSKPRTPKNWRDTVERMANRGEVFSEFTNLERWQITAYLVAITPTLQNSIMERRKQLDSASKTSAAIGAGASSNIAYDAAAAEETFNVKCSQCHTQELALQKEFASDTEVSMLITRMIANGLIASAEELDAITQYLIDYHDLPASEASATDANTTAGTDSASASTAPVMPELAAQNGCTGCHAIDTQLVGPGWADIADRYRNDPAARAQLIEAVKNGGSGNWVDQTGGIPMPANSPLASDEAIETLVDFILDLK